MKTILPCPKCHQFFLPPASPFPALDEGASLQCPGCGFQLAAERLFVDIDPNTISWSLVDGAINTDLSESMPAQHLSENLDGVVAEDTYSAIDEDHGFSTSGPIFDEALSTELQSEEIAGTPLAEVPPSNEWETQPSSLDGQNLPPDFMSSEAAIKQMDSPLAGESEFGDPENVESEFGERENGASAGGESADGELDDWIEDSADDVLILDDENVVRDDEFTDEVEVMFDEDSLVNDPVVDDAPLTLAPITSSNKQPRDPFNSLGKPQKKKPQESPLKMLFSVVGGGIAAVPIAILLMWYVLGKDPLKAGPVVAQLVPWIVPSQFSDAPGFRPRLAKADDRLNGMTSAMPKVQMDSKRDLADEPDIESIMSEPAPVEPAVSEPGLMKAEPMALATGNDTAIVRSDAEPMEPAVTPPVEPTVELTVEPKFEARAKPNVSDIQSELWDSIEQSNPAESIASLKASLASDPQSESHVRSVYDSITAVARNLETLHYQNSPSLKTWQQSVLKASAPIAKNRELLVALVGAKTQQVGSTTPNLSNDAPAVISGFSFIAIEKIVDVEGATQWLPNASTKKFWSSTRVLVPKSIQITGQMGRQYLLIGASRASQEGGSDYTTDFTVFVAVPLF